MTHDEYLQEKKALLDEYMPCIWEHESAGCFGDAENTRKWLRYELKQLDMRYEESQNEQAR